MKSTMRLLALFLVMTLLAALTACSPSESATKTTTSGNATTQENATTAGSGEKVKLIVSTYPADDQGTALRKTHYEDPMKEAFPNYDVSVEVFGDRQSLQVQVAGGGGPDILDLDGVSDVVEFAKADRVVALDGYAEQYGWNDMFYEWAFNSCYYQDKLFSLPTGFEGMVMYYNMDVFEANNYTIPTNVTELETMMADMKSKGIIPISFGNANYQGAVDWLYSTFLSCNSGPEALRSALLGETPFTDPIIKDSIDQMVNWWQLGYIGDNASQTITGDDMIAFFAEGRAAMMIDGTWAASQLLATYPELNWDCDVPPELRDGVGKVLPLATSGGYAINANSKFQDAAAEVLNWIYTSEDRQYKGMKEANYQPFPLKSFDIAKLEGMDDRLLRMYGILDEAQTSGKVGYCSWTFFPADARIYMNENTDALFLDSLSTEDYMTEVQNYVNLALEDGSAPPVP